MRFSLLWFANPLLFVSDAQKIVLNQTGGYLVRTKPSDVNEGGVATGFAALDSLYLV